MLGEESHLGIMTSKLVYCNVPGQIFLSYSFWFRRYALSRPSFREVAAPDGVGVGDAAQGFAGHGEAGEVAHAQEACAVDQRVGAQVCQARRRLLHFPFFGFSSPMRLGVREE